MNDEKLIDMVRDHQVLYDLSHVKYNDTTYKNSIWKEIAKQLNMDWPTCKNRWNNIRDNYRKSLKKTVQQSGASAKKRRPYKYESQMGLVRNFFEERTTVGNIKSRNGEEIGDEEILNNEELENVEENDGNSELPIEIDDAVDLNQPNPNPFIPNQLSQVPHEKRDNTINTIKRNKKKTFTPVALQTASSKLMDYLIEQKKESQSSNKHIDAVDGFLMGIGATLKTFPPYLLHMAKTEIFTTTQKYELQMLQQSNPSPSSSTSMPSSIVDNNVADYQQPQASLHNYYSSFYPH